MQKVMIAKKMIDFLRGDIKAVEHFLKVHSYAVLLGKLEKLDAVSMEILEIAAIVHDIACPVCMEKYGNCNGDHQEAESEALLRPFLAEFEMPVFMLERIIYLVTHHHTVTNIQGMDYQILIEADFLVNASEQNIGKKAVEHFIQKVGCTATGKAMLEKLFL